MGPADNFKLKRGNWWLFNKGITCIGRAKFKKSPRDSEGSHGSEGVSEDNGYQCPLRPVAIGGKCWEK